VDRRGPNECWPWLAAASHGQPKTKIGGKVVTARRIAWQSMFGDVPAGCRVLSTCGSHSVNPAHMTLQRAKLSPGDVRAIRRSRLPSKVLAALYRIDRGNVNRIQRGEMWGHVA
jgi:hypothetical protein